MLPSASTRRQPWRTRLAQCSAAFVLLCGCRGEPDPPELERLRLPTGTAIAPDGRWLFVANSNLDVQDSASSLSIVDLEAVYAALARMQSGAGDDDCRTVDDVVECDQPAFIRSQETVFLPSGAGNIAIDRPTGANGPLRLLIPSAQSRTISWVDVHGDGDRVRFDCGQAAERTCDLRHQVGPVAPDAGRLSVSTQGFRYAYLPHLLGDSSAQQGRVTLLALDSPDAVRVANVAGGIFDANDATLAGGFAVAERRCRLTAPPVLTMGCSRPEIFITSRFMPHLRVMSVQDGQNSLISSNSLYLLPHHDSSQDRPVLGAAAFVDPVAGDTLLVLQTTPPALLRVHISERNDGNLRVDLTGRTSLCRNPNLLAIDAPTGQDPLVFVSCFSDDQVAVVTLPTMQVIRTIAVSDGPNELVLDPNRRVLYVTSTLAGHLSLVDLDRTAPTFLTVLARLVPEPTT